MLVAVCCHLLHVHRFLLWALLVTKLPGLLSGCMRYVREVLLPVGLLLGR